MSAYNGSMFPQAVSQKDGIFQMLIDNNRDPLADWLDVNLGHTVSDNSIFSELPSFFEEDYHNDMDNLNVSAIMTWTNLM